MLSIFQYEYQVRQTKSHCFFLQRSLSRSFWIDFIWALFNISSAKEKFSKGRLSHYWSNITRDVDCSICGYLMYSMVTAHSDIRHEVRLVSRCLWACDWAAVKFILKFRHGTKGQRVLWQREPESQQLLCDFGMASNVDTRKVYIFTLAVGTISWSSQLQQIV